MEEKYKQIIPEDVFITTADRKPTEEERWLGVTDDFNGNRPTGNNFVDLFAYLIRKYGRKDTCFYARIMGVKTEDLNMAIRAMSGISGWEWRNRYLLLEAKELLEESNMQINDISAKLGFSQPSVFTKFFQANTHSQPWEWRINKKEPGKNWKKTYHWGE
ncbi:helix-turn-helix domain-containing protein [Parabacteroides sp. AM08-6]|uniref:helix-turn-helix domain-containing protein n=1 Tax=Parabacteroides sp. AM08-6 TaxID=2292053 RepID=UPI000EFF1AD8|nr:helix-turn-helix domain-containing protein [Parabacteroides sp. AM08-6]RHJ81545.1 AraC family transcriptional regulator [Parabacteroides sp. AM08-6]